MTMVHQSATEQPANIEPQAQGQQHPEIRLFSHSSLFYWWPIWTLGYLFALLTYVQGEKITIGGQNYLMHPSKNLGVFFTFVFTMVIILTNVTLRGLMS